jgi:hypothetical protein
VTFAAGWAFAGLALLVPLVILHLRRRGQVVREVPSLLLWDRVEVAEARGWRGIRPPALPVLLLLQVLALTVLVFALAKPTSAGPRPRPTQTIVLDDSWRMQAPGRLAESRRDVERLLAADRAGTQVRIVLANGRPSVLFRGDVGGALAASARVLASGAPADLSTALTVAGAISANHGSIVLVRAPEDAVPPVSSGAAVLRTVTLAGAGGDQGIFGAGARCGIGTSAGCEVYATLRNTASRAVEARIVAQAAGRPALVLKKRIGADSSVALALASQPGQQVSLRLQGHDSMPADDEAWVTVPAAGDLPRSSLVTLVGTPAQALATARAFAAVPGVTLALRRPKAYRIADARRSSLLVLDHFVPPGGLPPSPALLLVDPPRLPGGHVGGALAETVVSGTDGGSELLEGVDLSSLSIDSGAASRLTPPRWLAPVVWSPEGVLLSAGDSGRQRLAALSFEPGRSNLPQLPALPILAANLVQWAAGWAPPTASAGVPFAIDVAPGISLLSLLRDGVRVERLAAARAPLALVLERPGLYTVRESGAGAAREASIAVNTAEASSVGAAAVDLSVAGASSARVPVNRAEWLLAAALLLLFLEWAYWVSRRRVPAR